MMVSFAEFKNQIGDDSSALAQFHHTCIWVKMSGVAVCAQLDEKVATKEDDPRVRNGKKFVRIKGGGRNTESFDPKDSLVRPDMRVIVEKPTTVMKHQLKHDDVVIVPDFFCDADDWSIYYRLIEEMREIQDAQGPKADSKWISWAEGAHLISKDPKGSKTFDELQRRIVEYLEIKEGTYSTRFNWYRDSSDWKPVRICSENEYTLSNLQLDNHMTSTIFSFFQYIKVSP